jgi:hypothetical protein
VNTPRGGLRVAAIVFAIVCFAHAWRVVEHVDVTLGTFHAPMWTSMVAVVVSGGLSIWMLTLSNR